MEGMYPGTSISFQYFKKVADGKLRISTSISAATSYMFLFPLRNMHLQCLPFQINSASSSVDFAEYCICKPEMFAKVLRWRVGTIAILKLKKKGGMADLIK